MLLDARLEGELLVQEERHYQGRRYYEASLVSDDAQTLFLYEGQLKEVGDRLELGARYRVVFRPFVNNRWLELKIVELERIAGPAEE
ncbi:MAG: hypothetical protein AB7N76_27895 [Planctomycetota bacterium]